MNQIWNRNVPDIGPARPNIQTWAPTSTKPNTRHRPSRRDNRLSDLRAPESEHGKVGYSRPVLTNPYVIEPITGTNVLQINKTNSKSVSTSMRLQTPAKSRLVGTLERVEPKTANPILAVPPLGADGATAPLTGYAPETQIPGRSVGSARITPK
ncbi:hypothetical protein PIB30_019630 [Stylosanthes scabra]|uniref:Uncharacterized protein n=1 Tax=Stylosanthes scabra TaxID=79078 RepID=A0ABU6R8K8_9FABA|nr:hypothetical protein [Stylosanthes scabra]